MSGLAHKSIAYAKEGNALLGVTSGGPGGAAISLNSADTDGLMTSVATLDVAHTYAVASFDGVLVTPVGSGRFAVPRNVTVTTTTDAATYNTTDPIVITGVRAWDGLTVSENLTLTQAGGNETITGKVMFASVTSIYTPAQLTTDGAFTFGCGTAAMAVGACTGVVTSTNNHRDSGGGARGLYVGTSSSAHVYLMHWDDESQITDYQNVVAGTQYPWWFKSIHEGTTATNLRRGQ